MKLAEKCPNCGAGRPSWMGGSHRPMWMGPCNPRGLTLENMWPSWYLTKSIRDLRDD